jgi:hypothetical protein
VNSGESKKTRTVVCVVLGLAVAYAIYWFVGPRPRPQLPPDHRWFDASEVRLQLKPIEAFEPRSYTQLVILTRLKDGSIVVPVYHVQRPRYGSFGVYGETRRNEPLRAFGSDRIEHGEFPVSDDIASYILMLRPGQVGSQGAEWFVHEMPADQLPRGQNAELLLPDPTTKAPLRDYPDRDKLEQLQRSAQEEYSKRDE